MWNLEEWRPTLLCLFLDLVCERTSLAKDLQCAREGRFIEHFCFPAFVGGAGLGPQISRDCVDTDIDHLQGTTGDQRAVNALGCARVPGRTLDLGGYLPLCPHQIHKFEFPE